MSRMEDGHCITLTVLGAATQQSDHVWMTAQLQHNVQLLEQILLLLGVCID